MIPALSSCRAALNEVRQNRFFLNERANVVPLMPKVIKPTRRVVVKNAW